MVQWVEDPRLSLQWSGLLLWHKFNPWPRNFHMPWVWKKKEKEEEGEEREGGEGRRSKRRRKREEEESKKKEKKKSDV